MWLTITEIQPVTSESYCPSRPATVDPLETEAVIVLSHWPHVATHVATQVAAHVASVNGSIEIHGEQQVEGLVWQNVWQHVDV